VKDERMLASARRIVAKNEAEEVAIVRRNGALIAHAGGEETQQVDASGEDKVPEKGLPGVAAGVARTVARQVREFDLGAFRRCTIQGPFGIVVVGEVGGVLAAARHRAGVEPLRLWERLTVALEGAR
jgi:predicted regulator of Ras-like GTPase activity (Roadblock/LC7/MglB family)